MLETFYKQINEQMNHSIATLRKEYASLRTGRASISLLEGIKVSYYGNLTPLNQVGNLSAPDHHLITIQPWDASLIPEIEKAILKSDLGLNPANDGKIVRLPIPQLTEERRKEIVKHAKKLAEDVKVSLRNTRRNALDELKKMEKDKLISEDDHHRAQEKIQEIVDNFTKQINDIQAHKEAEIMAV